MEGMVWGQDLFPEVTWLSCSRWDLEGAQGLCCDFSDKVTEVSFLRVIKECGLQHQTGVFREAACWISISNQDPRS